MTIEATCKRVLQLDAEATPGPWGVNAGPLISTSLIVFATDGIVHEQVTGDVFEGHDAKLIATYRTAAPELAREYQRLTRKLEGEPSREEQCAADQREHGDKPCRQCHTCCLFYREEESKAWAKVGELESRLREDNS